MSNSNQVKKKINKQRINTDLNLFIPSDKDIRKYDENTFLKECKGYNYMPSILPKARRIIVIGDLHGDWKLTVKSLKKAGVIDDNLKWIGKDTVVVQIGDQVDRCRPLNYKCDHPNATIDDENSDIRILKLFTNLHSQAIKSKPPGAVYSLHGNHELMNVSGNLNYVSHKGLVGFADYKDPNNPQLNFRQKYNGLPEVEIGKIARKYSFAPGNEYGKFLACTRQSAIIIGSFLFVHAGITSELVSALNITGRNDLYKINFAVRKWLLGLIKKEYVDQIVGSYNYSMFWHRILGSIPPNLNNNDSKCLQYLNDVLKVFKIGKMVVGHTPQFFSNKDGINATCGNSLWRVDNGGSNAFSGFDDTYLRTKEVSDYRKAQVLEILNDNDIRIIS